MDNLQCLLDSGRRPRHGSLLGVVIACGLSGIFNSRYFGALGWAAGEAANMMIGNGIGLAVSESHEFEDGVAYYYAKDMRPFSIGGTVIGDKDWISGVRYHELAHATGKQRDLGPAYTPVHALSQGLSWLISGFTSTHRYNIFEQGWIEAPAQ
jgi:hypothetical protein